MQGCKWLLYVSNSNLERLMDRHHLQQQSFSLIQGITSTRGTFPGQLHTSMIDRWAAPPEKTLAQVRLLRALRQNLLSRQRYNVRGEEWGMAEWELAKKTRLLDNLQEKQTQPHLCTQLGFHACLHCLQCWPTPPTQSRRGTVNGWHLCNAVSCSCKMCYQDWTYPSCRQTAEL